MHKYIFKFELNRRMPNGTYGGVREGLNSPYSIAFYLCENAYFVVK